MRRTIRYTDTWYNIPDIRVVCVCAYTFTHLIINNIYERAGAGENDMRETRDSCSTRVFNMYRTFGMFEKRVREKGEKKTLRLQKLSRLSYSLADRFITHI